MRLNAKKRVVNPLSCQSQMNKTKLLGAQHCSPLTTTGRPPYIRRTLAVPSVVAAAPPRAAVAMACSHIIHACRMSMSMGTSVVRSSQCTSRPDMPVFLAPSRAFRTSLVVQMGRRSAKIALRKGKADAKKSKVYGRIGKKIIQIVKAGGPDPVANSKLSDLLRQAKDLGVPKDIIERNIKKASDAKQGDFQECLYEAYGPGGTGFVIEALTDNVNRTAGDVKSAITKGGGKPADSGSVMFNFMRQGQVIVEGCDEDTVFEAAIEAGADDVVPVFDEDGKPTSDFKLYTQVEAFSSAISRLQELGLRVNVEESELVYRGTAEVAVDDEAFQKCEGLMERLLELDDVDNVYTNCEGLA